MTDRNSSPGEPVRSWREGPAGYVELNRPEKANAYTQPMLDALRADVARLDADEEVRVVVICNAGQRAFCAGADRDELSGRDWRDALHLKSAEVFSFISRCRSVTMAAVGGAAIGGGLELALSCDLRIAAENARFAFPEPRLGLIPAAGGTQRLRQAVGKARAKELILGGLKWNADEALQFGLVSRVTAVDRLLPEAQAWAEQIAARDPAALALAKAAIDAGDAAGPGYALERVAEALLYRLRADQKRKS